MNLVNELQVSAENDDVLTVLRKTKRLASKLERQDLADWLLAEHAGYRSANSPPVPDYRRVATRFAYNTNGYVPAGFGYLRNGIEDLPPYGLDSPMPVRDSISTVLTWIESLDNGQEIYLPIDEGTDLSRSLRSLYQFDPLFARQITFLLHCDASQIKAIPERIKDTVLDWALALERAGVTGEGLTFTAKEKEIAHTVVFNINNSHVEQITTQGTNLKGVQ